MPSSRCGCAYFDRHVREFPGIHPPFTFFSFLWKFLLPPHFKNASQINLCFDIFSSPFIMSAPTPSQIQYQLDHIHQSKVPSIIATCVICLFIAYVGVLLRLASRRILGTSLKTDDWAIILSLVRSSIEPLCGKYHETYFSLNFLAIHNRIH